MTLSMPPFVTQHVPLPPSLPPSSGIAAPLHFPDTPSHGGLHGTQYFVSMMKSPPNSCTNTRLCGGIEYLE